MTSKKSTAFASLALDGDTPFLAINVPVDWQNSLALNKSVRQARVLNDSEGNLLITVAIPVCQSGGKLVQQNPTWPIFNEATGISEQQRTPTKFKVSTGNGAVSGNTTIWTPAAGKRFRFLGFFLTVSKDAACAAGLQISLNENGVATIWAFDMSSAALVATGQPVLVGYNLPGNGYLSAINNILVLTLNNALTAGYIDIVVYGDEE